MKPYLVSITLAFILFTAVLTTLTVSKCYAQNGEFKQSKNGLIYPDSTVKQLKHIVDSLNLKFKVCELNRVYYSIPQAKAHYVSLDTGNVKQAKIDMDNGIGYSDFIRKYKDADYVQDLLVTKSTYKNYKDKDVTELSSIKLGDKYSPSMEINNSNDFSIYNSVKGKWIYDYSDKTDYSSESIDAFYFKEDFSQQALPKVYAEMIQYSDCMVDTATQVYYKDAYQSGFLFADSASKQLEIFNGYIHNALLKKAKKPEEAYSYKEWTSIKYSLLDSLHLKDKTFNTLLIDAIADVLKNGGSDDDFETYVGRYYSKKTELKLKRNRRVVGACSQDDSPRQHALLIAKLSAETVNWEIFLRSHLDIMNDRFDRMSDGSYAFAKRKTYIKEIEVLDINVSDLLLGISLRIENPSTNHYYGSINRLGRALSETNNANEIETKMLQMICDSSLDDYNRVLIYYLFLNYNSNLNNSKRQNLNKVKLATAVKQLPAYLSSGIEKKK